MRSLEKEKELFETTPIMRAIAELAFPSIMGQVILVIYNMADTFFVGLTINAKTKSDKWLKWLMIIHGVFFFGCFIMPMTGVFGSRSSGETDIGGVIALEFWCAYFTPIGILSLVHFRKGKG